MTIRSVNPATGETLRTFSALAPADIEAALATAASAFKTWSATDLADRVAMLRRAADLLDAERETFGRLMTLEMGKTIRAAREEAAKCALGCRYYADHAAAFLAPEVNREPDGNEVRILYLPLGAILAVMPWNFPFWQVIRFAAPAMAAGNVVLLKHASNVPQCALAIEDLFRRAGAPAGVFRTLLIESGQVGAVVADPRVAAVTLTGSEGAGSEVGATAGKHLKKMVMELGGSDPFVVLSSADVAAAAATAVKARTVNNGQSCIAAKRFIVVDAVADAFERAFVDGMRTLVVGDPLDEATEIGPLATPRILADLEAQIARTVALGGRVLVGGARLDRPGNFFPATVITDLAHESPAYREELFGPVASLIRVPDADAALAVANDTEFGLGSAVWTSDPEEAERFARDLEAGQVFVNAMVASDPRFPFGGVKRSGYGRELGLAGMREFVNMKTVRFNAGPRTASASASGSRPS